MKHISFDLETLGNTKDAPIVQLGACKFDREGAIGDTFLANIDLESLSRYPDLTPDYSTIQWWMNQKPEAIESVFGYDLDRISLGKALHDFENWIGEHAKYRYWSHATFDPPIYANNCRVVGRQSQIPFRNYTDIRTLNHLTGAMDVGKRKGIHHNALDDAKFQASYISAALRRVQRWKERFHNSKSGD